MYHLEQFKKQDFEEIYRIMEESFPIEERRNRCGQEKIIDEPSYYLYGCRAQGKIAAFFAVWQFETFSFIEHFAVEKGSRNGGIGAGLLKQLLEIIKQPVILEVELPEDALKTRRIHFYERNGFALNGYDYVQPAMSKEGKAIPLLLMSYPAALPEEHYHKVRDTLYRMVYHVK